MTPDDYLRQLLALYTVDRGRAERAATSLMPVVNRWARGHLLTSEFSGSLAKGTGISLGTDADVLLSISSSMPGTLAQMYGSLWSALTNAGYVAILQNVSIGVTVAGQKIDLVPARRQSQWGGDHSLFLSKANSWTQTNVTKHINHVIGSGRTSEIRLVKLWRERNRLEFPSFFLELATIDALAYARGGLAANLKQVWQHLRDHVETIRCVDPANSNNVVSDDCTPEEKTKIANAAQRSVAANTWEETVW